MALCAYCQKPFAPRCASHIFHSPRCKAAWHKENIVTGTVTSIRSLKRGGWAVTIKYETLPPGIRIGGDGWCETGNSTRTDGENGHV